MALTDAKVKAAKPRDKPYKLSDGNQLYLYVTPAGGRHWRMNYAFGRNPKLPGRLVQKTVTFGAYPAITLGEARGKRDAVKAMLAEGRDPAMEKRIQAQLNETAGLRSFEAIARIWWAKNAPGWSAHHKSDVIRSLERDVFPHIGDLPIERITTPRLLEVLVAIQERPAIETAHRIRQRISDVFTHAIGSGVVAANPAADIRKAMKKIPSAVSQPAIVDLTGLRQLLIDAESTPADVVTKLALRFIALTAVRPGEVAGARWCEFEDMVPRYGIKAGEEVRLDQPLWRIPSSRMKGDQDRKAEKGGDHLVPLAHQAVELLIVLKALTGHSELLFPNNRSIRKPMSENTLRALLIRAGYHQRHVPHGFRAAFSTIMNERAREHGDAGDRPIIDLMLAHVPKDKVESAYNRAAFMPRRRELAQEWADVLLADFWPADVVGGAYRR